MRRWYANQPLMNETQHLRCCKCCGKEHWIRSTTYEDRDGAVGQHFDSLAAQHNCRDPAPPMGSHYNQIAPIRFRRIDNGLERMLVLDMDCIATHTDFRCRFPYLLEV